MSLAAKAHKQVAAKTLEKKHQAIKSYMKQRSELEELDEAMINEGTSLRKTYEETFGNEGVGAMTTPM